MNSNLKNRTFLRGSAARVTVAGAVATGAIFDLAACDDKDDSDTTPVQTATVTLTEELDDDRGNISDNDHVNN